MKKIEILLRPHSNVKCSRAIDACHKQQPMMPFVWQHITNNNKLADGVVAAAVERSKWKC